MSTDKRHENFLPQIIDKQTFIQVREILQSRMKTNTRAKNGNRIHRYSRMMKCGDCGAILIAKQRKWNGEISELQDKIEQSKRLDEVSKQKK